MTSPHPYADGCVLCRGVGGSGDRQVLRDDLSGLVRWWEAWGSVLLGVTQWGIFRRPLPRRVVRGCSLHNQVLENVQPAKCLGIAVTDGLDWGRRVNNVASGAAGALCFLQRNLALAPGGGGVQGCCMPGYGPSPVGVCGAYTEPLSPNKN